MKRLYKILLVLFMVPSAIQAITMQQAKKLEKQFLQVGIYNPKKPNDYNETVAKRILDILSNSPTFKSRASSLSNAQQKSLLLRIPSTAAAQAPTTTQTRGIATLDQNKLQQLNQANAQLQSQLQAEREQAIKLKQQAQAINQQNQQLYNKITQQDQQSDYIKQQLTQTQQQNTQLQQQVAQLQPLAQSAKNLVPALRKQNQEKDALISSAQQQNTQLQQQVTQLRSQSKQKEEALLLQLQAKSQASQNLSAQLEQTQKQLQNQALQQQQALTVQQLKNTKLQQQHQAQLQSELNKQKLEIQQDFQNRFKNYQTTQESKHQEQMSQLNQKNQQLQPLAKKAQALQLQLENLAAQQQQTESNNQQLQQQLQLAKQQQKEQQAQFEQQEGASTKTVQNLKQELQQLRTAQTSWNNTQNELNQKNQQLQKEKSQYEQQLNQLTNQIKQEQNQALQKIENAKQQLNEQKKQLNQQNIQLKEQLEQEKQKQQQQIDQLKKEKNDLEQSLEARLKIPQQEIRDLTLEVFGLENKIKEKVQEKENAINKAKQEGANALDKLKAEHLNAQKELQKQLKQQKDENDRIRAELANQTKQNETNKQQLEESATESQTIKELQNQLEQEKQQHLKALNAQKEASDKVLKATGNTLINLKNENKQLTEQLNKQKQSIEKLKQETPKGKTSSPINEQKSLPTDKSTFASRLSSSSAATRLALAKQKTYGNLQTHPLFKTLDLDEKTPRTVKFGNKTYLLKNPKQSAININENLANLPKEKDNQKEIALAKTQRQEINKVKAKVDEELKKVSAHDLSASLSISNLDAWEKIDRTGIYPEGSCGEKYAKNGTISLFTIHGTWSHKGAFGGDIHTLTTYNIFKFACQEAEAQKKKVEVISVSWSGDLNLEHRKTMAASLANEFKEKSKNGNEIWAIAHSHGCNVAAMAANQFYNSEKKLAQVGIFMGFPTLDAPRALDFKTVYAFYAQGDFTQVAGSAQSAANFDRKVPDFKKTGRKVYNIRMQLAGYDMDHVSIKWGVMPHLAKILTYIDTYYPNNFDLEANVETDPNSLPLVAIRRKEVGQNPAIGNAASEQDQRARETFKKKYNRDISTLGIKYISGITWLLNLAREAQSAWKGEPSIGNEYLEQVQDSSSSSSSSQHSSTSSDNK